MPQVEWSTLLALESSYFTKLTISLMFQSRIQQLLFSCRYLQDYMQRAQLEFMLYQQCHLSYLYQSYTEEPISNQLKQRTRTDRGLACSLTPSLNSFHSIQVIVIIICLPFQLMFQPRIILGRLVSDDCLYYLLYRFQRSIKGPQILALLRICIDQVMECLLDLLWEAFGHYLKNRLATSLHERKNLFDHQRTGQDPAPPSYISLMHPLFLSPCRILVHLGFLMGDYISQVREYQMRKLQSYLVFQMYQTPMQLSMIWCIVFQDHKYLAVV